MKHSSRKILRRFVATLLVGLASSTVYALAGETYDLAINNGRVMDPQTNFDGVRNVGIRDGKIITITKDKIEGVEVIDAKGYVVAPGFIDTHVHVVDLPFAQMAYKGRIQVGADADITVFDRKTVRDNSTTKQAGLPSTGIPYVLVNGTVVVKVLKGVYPGKAIRLPEM